MRFNQTYFSFCCLGFFLLSCSEDEGTKPVELEISKGNMVLICNEGNFRWGNASVGLLNLKSNVWVENAFQSINKRALGDVLQSASFWNNAWYLVVNNSSKIEAVSSEDFVVQKTITGLLSPRFLLPINNNKAYVSDIYARKIWILNQTSTSAVGSISFPGSSEEMVLYQNEAWISCRNKAKVFVVNTATDQLTDSISIPGNCTSIASSGNGKIWLGFEANGDKKAGILSINPISKLVEKVYYSNESNFYPSRFQMSATGDSLFFMHNGAFMIQAGDSDFPTKNLAEGYAGNWYGMGFDPKRSEIYLSDAKDFMQKSRILIINLKSGLKTERTAGIISSRFYFW